MVHSDGRVETRHVTDPFEGDLPKTWTNFPPLKKPLDEMSFVEMRSTATSILT